MQAKQSKTPTSCYCLKMRRATATVTKHYDQVLAPSGVTVNQYSMLLNISRVEPCSIRELADMADLDRSTLARNLQPLLRQGLVVDTKKAGTRSCQLALSECGREALEQAQALWAQAQAHLMETLGDQELDALEHVLRSLEGL